MKNLKLYIPFLLASFLLTGCYTQLAMRDYDYQKDEEKVTTREDQYYDSYEDTSEYYSDEETYNNEEYYEDETDEINNYYYGSYPFHHRYYWGYYPSVSFGIHFGYSYYDPYYWDSYYYWPWCGSYYYYPSYYTNYYYPGYYLPVFAYPYYGGHWSSNHGVYRERTNTGLRLRNNDGLRSSYTTRGTLTRGNDTRISKTSGIRQRDDINVKNPTRTGVSDRTGNTGIRKMKNEPPIEKRTKENNTVRNKTNNERKTPPVTIKKNNTNRNYDSNYKKPGNKSSTNRNKQTERKSGVKQEKKYSPPKTYSPPQKTYNPPRNNTPTQRNSNPPQNRSGNRGSNNSGGKRTR